MASYSMLAAKEDLQKFSCHSRPSRAEMPLSQSPHECSDLFPPRMQSRCAQTNSTEDMHHAQPTENSILEGLHTWRSAALGWNRRRTHLQATPAWAQSPQA